MQISDCADVPRAPTSGKTVTERLFLIRIGLIYWRNWIECEVVNIFFAQLDHAESGAAELICYCSALRPGYVIHWHSHNLRKQHKYT